MDNKKLINVLNPTNNQDVMTLDFFNKSFLVNTINNYLINNSIQI